MIEDIIIASGIYFIYTMMILILIQDLDHKMSANMKIKTIDFFANLLYFKSTWLIIIFLYIIGVILYRIDFICNISIAIILFAGCNGIIYKFLCEFSGEYSRLKKS